MSSATAADQAAAGARLWQRRVRTAQVLILVILIGGVIYVADTVVGGSLFRNPYTLSVQLPQAAGLHQGSVVTYRGQRIGEVVDVRLGDKPGVGAVAELEIDLERRLARVGSVELREGDDIEVMIADKRVFKVKKKPGNDAFLQQLRKYRGRLPADFTFDRDDANARG